MRRRGVIAAALGVPFAPRLGSRLLVPVLTPLTDLCWVAGSPFPTHHCVNLIEWTADGRLLHDGRLIWWAGRRG